MGGIILAKGSANSVDLWLSGRYSMALLYDQAREWPKRCHDGIVNA